jgi:cytochrome c oxidase assembly protein subunit 15
VLSPGWFAAGENAKPREPGLETPLAFVIFGLITVQYLLGGAIRHHHTGLYEHLGLGLLTLFVVLANAVIVRRSGNAWVRASGRGLLLVVLAQVALGLGTWVSKWGFAPWGIVATADSIGQVALRSLHMVIGVLVFASAVVHTLRVWRTIHVSGAAEPQPLFATGLPQGGGAA